ncbi:MAG: cellulase family glycosylhydrolase, partial [Candidatus Hydrogenedentota bacterium]
WRPVDTRDEQVTNLELVNPDPMNLISVHLYPQHARDDRYEDGHHASYEELLSLVKTVGRDTGKPVFIGEFGTSNKDFQSEAEIAEDFERLLSAIVESECDLAAVWNFDFKASNPGQDPFTITRENHRGYMLDRIRETNVLLAK